jgi:hypothetical protein
MKVDKSPFAAARYCENNGMAFFDASTSPELKTIFSKIVKKWVGFPKASLAIKGRTGQRCSVINGVGKYGTAPCKFAHHFVCEYVGGESF